MYRRPVALLDPTLSDLSSWRLLLD